MPKAPSSSFSTAAGKAVHLDVSKVEQALVLLSDTACQGRSGKGVSHQANQAGLKYGARGSAGPAMQKPHPATGLKPASCEPAIAHAGSAAGPWCDKASGNALQQVAGSSFSTAGGRTVHLDGLSLRQAQSLLSDDACRAHLASSIGLHRPPDADRPAERPCLVQGPAQASPRCPSVARTRTSAGAAEHAENYANAGCAHQGNGSLPNPLAGSFKSAAGKAVSLDASRLRQARAMLSDEACASTLGAEASRPLPHAAAAGPGGDPEEAGRDLHASSSWAEIAGSCFVTAAGQKVRIDSESLQQARAFMRDEPCGGHSGHNLGCMHAARDVCYVGENALHAAGCVSFTKKHQPLAAVALEQALLSTAADSSSAQPGQEDTPWQTCPHTREKSMAAPRSGTQGRALALVGSGTPPHEDVGWLPPPYGGIAAEFGTAAELICLLNPEAEPTESLGAEGGRDGLLERFQRALGALESLRAAELRGDLARFGARWLEVQQRQLALVGTLGLRGGLLCPGDEAHGGPAGLDALVATLVDRCRMELAGTRSAFQRLCESPALAERHLLLLCSAVTRGEDGGAALELSDGRYFLPAELDVPLRELVLAGRLRPGQLLRSAIVQLAGLPAGGCDALAPPPGLRLQLCLNACRPCRAPAASPRPDASTGRPMARDQPPALGFQRRLFPPARLAELREGGGPVPIVDVVVIRVLPLVFRSWRQGSRQGAGSASTEAAPPEDRSLSQECARAQDIAEEEFRLAASTAVGALGGADEDVHLGESVHTNIAALHEQVQSRIAARVAAGAGVPQLPLLVLDAQAVAKRCCGPALWNSIAILILPASADTEDSPRPLDRMRVTCLRVLPLRGPSSDAPCRSGPLRLFSSRSSRLQLRRARGDGPAGLEPRELPLSPLCRPGLPALAAGGGPYAEPRLLQPVRGHFCDLVGLLLHVSSTSAQQSVGAHTGGRATCTLWLLTGGGHVCQVRVDEYGAGIEETRSRLERAMGAYKQCEGYMVAVQNVTIGGHSASSGLAYFRARRLQLRVSQHPSNVDLHAAVLAIKLTPASVSRAIAMLTSMGFHVKA